MILGGFGIDDIKDEIKCLGTNFKRNKVKQIYRKGLEFATIRCINPQRNRFSLSRALSKWGSSPSQGGDRNSRNTCQ